MRRGNHMKNLMRSKKLVAVLAAGALSLGLAGCPEDEADEDPAVEEPAEEPAEEEEDPFEDDLEEGEEDDV
jgi:hypothetical protein